MRQILASVATVAVATESQADIFTSTVQGIIQTLTDTRDSNNKALTEWEKYFHRSQCLCNSVNAAASVNLGTQIAKFEDDLKIAQQEQETALRKKSSSEIRENLAIQADRDGRNDAAKNEVRTEESVEQLTANRDAALKCYRVLTNDASLSLIQGKQANSLLQTLKVLRKQMANGGTSLDTFQQSRLLSFQDELATHKSLSFLGKSTSQSVRNEAFKVGEVAGICKELADDFQRQKEELLKNSADMKEATTSSLRTLNNDISLNQREIALHSRNAMNKSFQTAELKTAIAALKSQQEAHTMVKKTAAESCAEVAMAYHKEVNEILQQNENISQAVDFLHNGLGDLARAQGVKEARQTPPVFVQIKANTKSILSTMRTFYHRFAGSEPVTNFLATGMHASSTVITPDMIKPILSLIEELQTTQAAQQKAEADDYDECKDRIAEFRQDKADLDRDIEDTTAKITLKTDEHRRYVGTADEAREEGKELSTQAAEMTKIHSEKMSNLTKEMEFKEKAIDFLTNALQRLSASLKLIQVKREVKEQFKREAVDYENQSVDGRVEALPDVKKELSMDVADAMSNLSSMSSNTPQTKTGTVTGPHGALNAVLMQLQEEVTTIRKDIEQDQQKYTSEMNALQTSISAAETVATDNDGSANQALAERTQEESNLKQAEVDLKGTNVTLQRLEVNCSTLLQTYALRKQHYDTESAAIITVKSQLESLIGTTLRDDDK